MWLLWAIWLSAVRWLRRKLRSKANHWRRTQHSMVVHGSLHLPVGNTSR
ncbi:hypothetical protein ACNKHN_03540 [Shigella flexneri]